PSLHPATGRFRHTLPAPGLGGDLGHTAGPHRDLRRARARPRQRRPCGRPGLRCEPLPARRPLPPRHRRHRPRRLRPRAQALAARPRSRQMSVAARAEDALAAATRAELDAFTDSLWLEHGLSRNTLAGYRSDLALFARWLEPRGGGLRDATAADLAAYLAEFARRARPASQRRLLSAWRRYFRHLLTHQQIAEDPTLFLDPPMPAQRFPRTLSETQVEALLAAPDTGSPLGLRDRCMLE